MRPIDEIVDKIKEIKGFKNDIQLARHLKAHPSTIGNWRLRKTIPYDVVVRFCLENDIDPIWLLDGKASRKYPEIDNPEVYSIVDIPKIGEQLKKVQELLKKVRELTQERNQAVEEANKLFNAGVVEDKLNRSQGMEKLAYSAVPVYETVLEGESGATVERQTSLGFVAMTNGIWRNLKTEPSALMIFRIGGDFMEPTLREGDFALVDRKSRDPRDGGIYVLKFAGGTTCRRIQVMKNRTLLAKSDNSLYEPLSIDLTKDKDVVFVGRVIWAGKSMG